MAEQVKIFNDKITLTASCKGAELTSVKKDGKEILWDADPNVWASHAPLMFPICGGLKDDKFIYNGKEYILKKHGYARMSQFELEKSDKTSITFLLKSDDESRAQFPFDYETRVTYTLIDNKLNIQYSVKNTGKETMYFDIGSHEAYACPEGIEEYSVLFDKEENLDSSILDGNLLEYNTVSIAKNTKELPLKYDYFAVDALVFLNLKSRKVSLKHKTRGKVVEINFDGTDYLLLWTKPGAKYICIEPWCGVPDFVDSDYDITKKRGIIALESGKTCVRTHSINF